MDTNHHLDFPMVIISSIKMPGVTGKKISSYERDTWRRDAVLHSKQVRVTLRGLPKVYGTHAFGNHSRSCFCRIRKRARLLGRRCCELRTLRGSQDFINPEVSLSATSGFCQRGSLRSAHELAQSQVKLYFPSQFWWYAIHRFHVHCMIHFIVKPTIVMQHEVWNLRTTGDQGQLHIYEKNAGTLVCTHVTVWCGKNPVELWIHFT